MQYVTYIELQYKYLLNSGTGRYLRIGRRYGMLVYDYELTETGFSGIENIDWVCFKRSDYISAGSKIREGVRDTNYVKDAEIINTTGFDGIEDTDFENMQNISDAVRDGNTILWWDADDKYINNPVKDKLGSGNDVITGSCGLSDEDGFTFNGIDQYLRTANFALAQPFMVYIVFKQDGWGSTNRIFSGAVVNSSELFQQSMQPMYKADGEGAAPDYLLDKHSLKTFGILKILFNGANSTIQIDDTAKITGYDFNSSGLLGITLGANYENVAFSKISVKDLIIRSSSANETVINNYLKHKNILKYQFNKGKVLFTWDGDEPTILNGINLFSTKGNIPSTYYLCQNFNNAGMLNEWSSFRSTGLDLQDHGYTHEKYTDLLAISEATLIAELDAMKAGLLANGFPEPKHCAYPYGANNLAVQAVVEDYGLETARGIREHHVLVKKTNKYDLPAINLTPTSLMEDMKSQIDYAVANKSAVIFYNHGFFGDPQWTIEQMGELLDYAIASDVDIISMSTLSDLLI